MKKLNLQTLRKQIRTYKDWPKKGINFLDITKLLYNRVMFRKAIRLMVDSLLEKRVEVVLCPESRGFIFGAAVAMLLSAGVLVARKSGKLPPCPKKKVSYNLEYGKDALEIPSGFIRKGTRVAIVDDVLATGGTAKALEGAVTKMGGVVVSNVFLIEIKDCQGRGKLESLVYSILDF
ncbi:MAG: adenine phosphoribosyltransferase [Candidatus Brocadiia bacterium]